MHGKMNYPNNDVEMACLYRISLFGNETESGRSENLSSFSVVLFEFQRIELIPLIFKFRLVFRKFIFLSRFP